MSTLAELESRVAALETRLKPSERKGRGPAPYGFRRDHGKLLANLNEQTVIGMITYGRKRGLSMQKIAHSLNTDGYKTRAGGEWRVQYVDRILRAQEEPGSAHP